MITAAFNDSYLSGQGGHLKRRQIFRRVVVMVGILSVITGLGATRFTQQEAYWG